MNELLTRIISKIYRVYFVPCYWWKFKSIGTGSAMFRPFRIDGSNGIAIGKNTIFQRGGWLYCRGIQGRESVLTIGEGCAFGYNNHITSAGKVIIGNNVLTANNVYISDNIHDYEDINTPIIYQMVRFKQEVIIGDGSWIGENACIIGARIGKNCVIGANAVVTSDIPDYSVAVGMPAVVIKQFDQQLKKWVSR
jgi:acetyltransferase-like isoleucine patch superfamily enzyme